MPDGQNGSMPILGRILRRLSAQEAGQDRLETLVVVEAEELSRLLELIQVQDERILCLEARVDQVIRAAELLQQSLVVTLVEPPASHCGPRSRRRWPRP